MNGQVVHFEIPADDLARAQEFYRAAFGWQINSMPGMDYSLVTTTPSGDAGPLEPGAINGGMLARQEPVTAPVVVIEVDDIDAALGQVEGLGGTVIRGKDPVGDMGFSAYVLDTEGNTVGLWQNAT
jgi:predicted enzyme related to lactoylglutathione lyase